MKKILSTLLSLICIAIWLYSIWYTDSRISVYVFIAIFSAIASICLAIKPAENNKRDKVCSAVYAGLLALAIALSNYPIYTVTSTTYIEFYLKEILVFATGLVHLYSLSRFAIDRLKNFSWKKHEYKLNPIWILLISTIVCCVIYLIVFYGKFYPGVITADSEWQISQAIKGEYTNHHPVYHTFIIRGFICAGVAMGMNINEAIAMFTIFQIIVMSLTFGYVQMTLSEIKVPIWVLIVTELCYALLPYHIAYASTIWKDIPFALAVVAFTVSLYRIINDIGKNKLANYIVIGISGLGVCLFRSNGIFAYSITLIVFIILFWKQKMKKTILLVGVLVVALILKYPVLKKLSIPQHDTIEALSIPSQQIARVIAEGNGLTEEEYAIIDNVADIGRIPSEYNPYLSDPIKGLVRESGNQDDIKKYVSDYISLYISLGMAYPLSYINGWVDQTKGYWNGGYDYWVWTEGVYPNEYGIVNSHKSDSTRTLWDSYSHRFISNPLLQLFISIGLNVWILLGITMLCIANKDKNIIISVPILAILLSIVISTPVYAEFRYIYALFSSLPFIIVATLSGSKGQ